MRHCVHFCSTPRNVFLSLGLAWQQPDAVHHLVLIDQVPGESSPLVRALTEKPGPFATIDTLHKGVGTFGKRRTRRAHYRRLTDMAKSWRPTQVYVGNDRRIEFQYFMHKLAQQQISSEALYVEDGINSYVGVVRQRTKPLTDRYVEPLLKALFYGRWYDRSALVGCSHWVDQRLLTFPDCAAEVPGPKRVWLAPTPFLTSPFSDHMRDLNTLILGADHSVNGDLLFVMPHSNDLIANSGSIAAFREAVAALIKQAGSVYVKYHPRETRDPLADMAIPLPTALPIEMLLSTSRFHTIVGDTSAALMSIRWLSPESKVFSVRNKNAAHAGLFALMAQVGITVIDDFSEAF